MSGRDSHDPFALLALPHAVHFQALKLLARIVQARTASETLLAANRAEGFVLGLETVKALNAARIEVLYLEFDGASQTRQVQLELQG